MRGDCLEPWGSVLLKTLMLPQVKDLSVGHWVPTTSLLGMGPLSWRLSTCPAHCPLRPQMVHRWVADAKTVQGDLRTIHSPPSPFVSLLSAPRRAAARPCWPHTKVCVLWDSDAWVGSRLRSGLYTTQRQNFTWFSAGAESAAIVKSDGFSGSGLCGTRFPLSSET